MKKILFITWDGPGTNYLEALFVPIFKGLMDAGDFEFHVVQFSWADGKEVDRIRQVAQDNGIVYKHFPIRRKPVASVGAIWAVMRGADFLKSYVKTHNIDTLMPRSNMPAWMVNKKLSWYKKQSIQIVFDADGMPLEERVDFAGLSKESFQYKWLKKQESKMILHADNVLTRSQQAVRIHTDAQNVSSSKFQVVSNGRDIKFFKYNENDRKQVRKELGLQDPDTLFIYVGSLGPQYAWEEMLAIFLKFQEKHTDSYFLILSRQEDFLYGRIPEEIKNRFFVRQAEFSKIPAYLSAADLGFSLRQPTFSMQGVFPIKLGEYLLTGLPTIASKGVGDTEKLLEGISTGMLYDHHDPTRVEKAVNWIEGLESHDRTARTEVLLQRFGLEETVSRYLKVISSL